MADTRKHLVTKSRWKSKEWKQLSFALRGLLACIIDQCDQCGLFILNEDELNDLTSSKPGATDWRKVLREKLKDFLVPLSDSEFWVPSVIRDTKGELRLSVPAHHEAIAFIKERKLEKLGLVSMCKDAKRAKLAEPGSKHRFKKTKATSRLRKPSKKYIDSLPTDPALITEEMISRVCMLVYVKKSPNDKREALPRREWCEAYHRIRGFTYDFNEFWQKNTISLQWSRKGKLISNWCSRMDNWATTVKPWERDASKVSSSQQPSLKIAVDPDEAVKRMHELTLEDKKRRMEQEIPRSPGLIKELARAR